MSEVKNEGLEAVATFDGLYLVPLAIMDAGTELCRHSEALAGYAVRDAQIAELESDAERLNAGWQEANGLALNNALERDSYRAVLEGAEYRNLDVMGQQSIAESRLVGEAAKQFCLDILSERDQLRAELAAIKAQEPVGWYTDNHLTDKSSTTYDWAVAERWADKGWQIFPLYAAPVAKQVVMPDDDELMQMAFEIGDPDENACGYWFEMESFDEFVMKLRALLATPAPIHDHLPDATKMVISHD